MDIQQLPKADLLDILFDGRNKEYGAYDLRKSYNRRLWRAVLTTLALCLLLFVGFSVAGKTHAISRVSVSDSGIVITEVKIPNKELPLPIPKPVRATPPAPTIRIVTTRIVPDKEVIEKPQEAIVPDDVRIGTTTNLSATGPDVTQPISDASGTGLSTGLVEKPKPNDEDGIFDGIVQIESSYPGGIKAWQRFLLKNFRPPQSEEESGDVTVRVRFVVDKEGNISDVEALDGPAALQKEALRVIRLSGKWEPAIQNGRKVKTYKIQPITIHWEN